MEGRQVSREEKNSDGGHEQQKRTFRELGILIGICRAMRYTPDDKASVKALTCDNSCDIDRWKVDKSQLQSPTCRVLTPRFDAWFASLHREWLCGY